MKRQLCFLLILAIACSIFAGCEEKAPAQTLPDPTVMTEAMVPTEATEGTEVIAETAPQETAAPAVTEPAPTEPAATDPVVEEPQPEEKFPYLQKVTHADQSIYGGPSYDYGFVDTVKLAGTYTIVEEAWDDEGNLWGKLKSGVGWIDLTEVRGRIASPPPVSANYADDLLLDGGNFEHFVADSSEYAVKIAFRANEVLTDVVFYSMQLMETEFEMDEALYSLPELTPDKPFVAQVLFPGDMSMYGIRFTDSSGHVRSYQITISGRNGSLFLMEDTAEN